MLLECDIIVFEPEHDQDDEDGLHLLDDDDDIDEEDDRLIH